MAAAWSCTRRHGLPPIGADSKPALEYSASCSPTHRGLQTPHLPWCGGGCRSSNRPERISICCCSRCRGSTGTLSLIWWTRRVFASFAFSITLPDRVSRLRCLCFICSSGVPFLRQQGLSHRCARLFRERRVPKIQKNLDPTLLSPGAEPLFLGLKGDHVQG